MTIRTRLLIILVATALIPLGLTSLTYQVSTRVAHKRLTTNTRDVLDTNARRSLQEHLRSYGEILQRDRQLGGALLERQARDIESALAAEDVPEQISLTKSTFGFDPNLPAPSSMYHQHFRDANDPEVSALQIDYQRQGYSVLPHADPNKVTQILKTLAPLTRSYHEVYTRAPKGTLWLVTHLDNGVITWYPAGGSSRGLPDRAAFRGQSPPGRWGRPVGTPLGPGRLGPPLNAPRPFGPSGGQRPRDIRRVPALIDPATGLVVMVAPMQIRTAQGSSAGRTSIMRTIPEIFENMALPERWGTDIERMLIMVDPNTGPEPTARILLHDDLDQSAPKQRRRIIPGKLASDDDERLQVMIDNIIAGDTGVQEMSFKGRSCLWAYHPLEITSVTALLIVPYERVTRLAEDMKTSLTKESLFWLEITTAVFGLAAICAVVLAVVRARSLTRPISTLVDASRRLARGDFETQVRITSGDELEHLGKAFNEIGPKLREHATMKLSLELAGAVQQNLLPGHIPHLRKLEVVGRCLYCDETGGDYFDFIDLSKTHPDTLGLVLGDVSGHGIGAALLMASIRGIIRAEIKEHPHQLAQLLTRVNQQVVQDTEADQFVTLFSGLLEDQTRSFSWASAGHEPAVWLHSHNKVIEELPNTGMPLGILDDASFEQVGPIVLAPDDILMIGTDGIWDARNAQGQFYGKERFWDSLKENAHLCAEEIIKRLIANITEFVGSAPRTDDITLVLVKAR
jgi:phosphoserine phosphatase RsbU/P